MNTKNPETAMCDSLLEKPQLKVLHGTGKKIKGGYMTRTKEGGLVFIAQETYRERMVREYEEGRQMSSKIPYPGKPYAECPHCQEELTEWCWVVWEDPERAESNLIAGQELIRHNDKPMSYICPHCQERFTLEPDFAWKIGPLLSGGEDNP